MAVRSQRGVAAGNRLRVVDAHPPDYVLLVVVAVLLAIGIVMVYSASMVDAQASMGDSFYFLKRQGLWAGLGLVGMLAFTRLDYSIYQKYARPLLLGCAVLLVLVLVPGIGLKVLGARRWLGFSSARFQPSELTKLGMIIFLADFMARRQEQVPRFWRFVVPVMLLLGLLFGLIMLEPDLGTSLVLAGIVFLMLLAGGANVWHLSGVAFLAVPGVGVLSLTSSYRAQRLFTFLDPFKDPQGSSWQIIQALYALGSGGLFGLGLGRSRQKFFYLPERHTDMIFAILGEELGLVGTLLVLVLIILFAWRGYRIAVSAPDRFSSLLAVGVTSWITLQACMNIAVVTSTIPMTGIPLPFISYGGSSLLFTMVGVGILLGISRHSRQT